MIEDPKFQEYDKTSVLRHHRVLLKTVKIY